MLENFPAAPNSPRPGTSPGISWYPSLHTEDPATIANSEAQTKPCLIILMINDQLRAKIYDDLMMTRMFSTGVFVAIILFVH